MQLVCSLRVKLAKADHTVRHKERIRSTTVAISQSNEIKEQARI